MHATRIARSATRSMRIIALPLTPPCKPISGKTAEHLTYYHFITPPDNRKSTWSKWIVAKASDLWAGLGKAPEGNWKRRAFLYGERLVDRLDFEELALKSLDPSLGPRLSNIVHTSKEKEKATPQIPLIYPPSACTSPLPHIQSLLAKRTPRHKKGFWFWLAISPLTAPFALIPIIPNFPFFFCVWRSWSHYRAYKASQYLEGFVKQGAIIPQTSPELDAIYAKYAPAPLPSPSPDSEKPPPPPSEHARAASSPSEAGEAGEPAPEHAQQGQQGQQGQEETAAASAYGPRLLLRKEAVPELQKLLELPEDSTFAADVYRALEQARLRLEGGQKAA
ncbi:mitochondrial K+-H+ exchange-related-domain-containing protein [Cubamyces lactineus]|nr:mitochondrial K+-H+ exchange-related-domain-containing protein [Cubamyces lactineus]